MDEVVLNSTKDDIIQVFGLPDEKKTEGSYEEWIYLRGQRTISYRQPTYSRSIVNVKPVYDDLYADVNTMNYGGTSYSRTIDVYIKVLFQDGIAVSWDTRGVDYSERDVSAGATLGAILGTVIAIGGVVALSNSVSF